MILAYGAWKLYESYLEGQKKLKVVGKDCKKKWRKAKGEMLNKK